MCAHNLTALAPIGKQLDHRQAMLNECLGSVVAGRPIWRASFATCLSEKNETKTQQHDAIQRYIDWDSHAKVQYDKRAHCYRKINVPPLLLCSASRGPPNTKAPIHI